MFSVPDLKDSGFIFDGVVFASGRLVFEPLFTSISAQDSVCPVLKMLPTKGSKYSVLSVEYLNSDVYTLLKGLMYL